MTGWQNALGSNDLVVAFESSPYSDAALDFAVELAEQSGATLHIVHVQSLADYPIDPDIAGSEAEAETIRSSLAHVRAEVERALGSFSGKWTYSNEKGNIVDRVNEIADRYNALAIIIGSSTSGIGGVFHRALKGSVLKYMTKGSGRVVMVVPKHPPAGDERTATGPEVPD
ncbi:universal stress protein [Streptomyces halstedii]|uniref:universal stress protein n=1 Tax=Streptomyces halstedii TaxID=1944 RepID=UPI0036749294